MIRKILIWLITICALAFIGAIVLGLFLPKDYTVTREVLVDADQEVLYSLIGDLSEWKRWQPWSEQDPDMEVTLGPIVSGVGASQSWVGKDGDGNLVFTEAEPSRGVAFDLFFNQGKAECDCWLVYEKADQGYRVTWTMAGRIPIPVLGGYLAKAMDGMLGPAFESGLRNLKEEAETASAAKESRALE